MSKQIVFIWALPRSRSTCLERSLMENSQVVKVFHEPFCTCFYYGSNKKTTRDLVTDRLSEESSELVPEKVMQNILDEAKKLKPDERILVKEMSYAMTPYLMENPELLETIRECQNYFLIRNPYDQISSLYHMSITTEFKTFDPIEIGYDQMLWLVENLDTNTNTNTRQIIDSDILVQYPKFVLDSLSKKIGLRFEDNMMDWTDKSLEHFKLWSEWHQDVIKSKTIDPIDKSWAEYSIPEDIKLLCIKYRPMYINLLQLSKF
jgi:hypothetical protein